MIDVSLLMPPALAGDERFRDLGVLIEDAFHSIRLEPLLIYLVDIARAEVLPHLAEQFSLMGDGWEMAETEMARRAMIKGSILIHQRKGTPWAIRRVFTLLGLGDIEIEEGRSGYRRDGSMRRDGFVARGEKSLRWAEYRIRMKRLLSIPQANDAIRLLGSIAPARCRLHSIDFRGASLIRNGLARRDGTYTRGLIG
uniref:Phage tail protein, P2 protein I family n=1 Tax=Candidatus Kentrum sp. TC TaxID=2126339 RepID=A0A450Z5N5_9GAMM|nr:MAG: phage tail protein, P2 protein I family [Candidatus Kentron sp. TC]